LRKKKVFAGLREFAMPLLSSVNLNGFLTLETRKTKFTTFFAQLIPTKVIFLFVSRLTDEPRMKSQRLKIFLRLLSRGEGMLAVCERHLP
jgi:hypothetical protein